MQKPVIEIDMSHEIYYDIPGYEGYYQISNYGNIKNIRSNKTLRVIKNYNSKNYYYCKINLNKKGKRETIKIHNIVKKILFPDSKLYMDHIDRNTSNNRFDNFRLVTHQENSFNRSSHKGSKSKYKGLAWVEEKNKWRTKICINKKSKHVGYFENEIEAAKAYDKAAKKHFGEYANLNFK